MPQNNTNGGQTETDEQQLIEAIDRLMEAYRDTPKYPYDKKAAKRTSYRNVIVEVAKRYSHHQTEQARYDEVLSLLRADKGPIKTYSLLVDRMAELERLRRHP
jgi:hypothetical protein